MSLTGQMLEEMDEKIAEQDTRLAQIARLIHAYQRDVAPAVQDFDDNLAQALRLALGKESGQRCHVPARGGYRPSVISSERGREPSNGGTAT